jgi:hypothetical protein
VASEEIVARLRLRNVLRFQADAKRAEHSIKDIKDAAKDGDSWLNQLGSALKEFASNIPQATGRTRIFGFAIGTVVTAAVASIPVIVGLGGALTALAGSAGAAAVGAGGLAAGLVGLALPMGALALVTADALDGINKVGTAYQRWQVAVGTYGRNSQQAETALRRLNAITQLYGGESVLNAVKALDHLRSEFRRFNQPAIQVLIAMFTDLVNGARTLIPIFAKMAYAAANVVRGGLDVLIARLTGAEFSSLADTFTSLFQALGGPLITAATNLLFGFLNLGARMGPFLGYIVDDIVALSVAFQDWATNGNLGGIISQFFSWYDLLKAVGGLLFTILTSGASQGQGMVDTLTDIVNKWNAFLQTPTGQSDLKSFFADAINFTKSFIGVIASIIGVIFQFGRAALPLYTAAIGAAKEGFHEFMDAIAPAEPFFRNILGPLLLGIAKGVIGSVVGAFKFLIFVIRIVATVLGWLGTKLAFLKPVMFIIGQIIGFIAGGPILKFLGGLGKINILLGPLGALFRMLAIPLRMAGGLIGWIGGKIAGLLGWFGKLAYGAIPIFRGAINGVIKWLTGAGAKFFNAGFNLWKRLGEGIRQAIGSGLGFAGDIGKAVYNFIAGHVNSALPNSLGPINIPDNPIPMMASGGVVSGSGSWITGERGPEINTLRNGRVTVVPLTPGVNAQGTGATLNPSGGTRTIVTKVFLKGRQIAEAVADELEDEKAR